MMLYSMNSKLTIKVKHLNPEKRAEFQVANPVAGKGPDGFQMHPVNSRKLSPVSDWIQQNRNFGRVLGSGECARQGRAAFHSKNQLLQ